MPINLECVKEGATEDVIRDYGRRIAGACRVPNSKFSDRSCLKGVRCSVTKLLLWPIHPPTRMQIPHTRTHPTTNVYKTQWKPLPQQAPVPTDKSQKTDVRVNKNKCPQKAKNGWGNEGKCTNLRGDVKIRTKVLVTETKEWPCSDVRLN